MEVFSLRRAVPPLGFIHGTYGTSAATYRSKFDLSFPRWGVLYIMIELGTLRDNHRRPVAVGGTHRQRDILSNTRWQSNIYIN